MSLAFQPTPPRRYNPIRTHLRRATPEEAYARFVLSQLASIPQNTPRLKALAVQTIACYCAAAHAFIICAPTTEHVDTGKVCDVGSYQRRMWCRCEQLCHVMRKGTSSMWCATTVDDCKPLGELGREWLMTVLRVFEGDVTDEKDKLSIVLPILGLYAELYAVGEKRGTQGSSSPLRRPSIAELGERSIQITSASRRGAGSMDDGEQPPSPPQRSPSPQAYRRKDSAAAASCQRDKSPSASRWPTDGGDGRTHADSDGSSTSARDHTLRLVLSEIHRGRSDIFPPKLPMSAAAFAQLPLWKRMLSRLPKCLFGEAFDPRMDLFGELIQLIERSIEHDPHILTDVAHNHELTLSVSSNKQGQNLWSAPTGPRLSHTTSVVLPNAARVSHGMGAFPKTLGGVSPRRSSDSHQEASVARADDAVAPDAVGLLPGSAVASAAPREVRRAVRLEGQVVVTSAASSDAGVRDVAVLHVR